MFLRFHDARGARFDFPGECSSGGPWCCDVTTGEVWKTDVGYFAPLFDGVRRRRGALLVVEHGTSFRDSAVVQLGHLEAPPPEEFSVEWVPSRHVELVSVAHFRDRRYAYPLDSRPVRPGPRSPMAPSLSAVAVMAHLSRVCARRPELEPEVSDGEG